MLIYRSQRAEVLSNNIANADTPNFNIAIDGDLRRMLHLESASVVLVML